MNHELAKTLTTALVQFIDRERPEGTMCCSNAECKSIEEMFEGECFDIIETFIQKKLSGLTEFEQEVSDIVEYCKEHGENVAFDYAKRHAKTLLALAKKQLLSYADESNPDKLPQWREMSYYPPQCGTNVTIVPDINSGTSTATLHGNTSATDDKEHNPSFTD